MSLWQVFSPTDNRKTSKKDFISFLFLKNYWHNMCHKSQFAWFPLQNKIYGNPIMKFFVSLSVELRDQKFNNFFGFVRKRSIRNLSHFCYDYNVGVSLKKFCLENEIESDSAMPWSPQQQKKNCQFNSSILIRFKVSKKNISKAILSQEVIREYTTP